MTKVFTQLLYIYRRFNWKSAPQRLITKGGLRELEIITKNSSGIQRSSGIDESLIATSDNLAIF